MLNRRGQTGAWEAVIIIILIIVIVGLVYLLYAKKSSTQKFEAGSQSTAYSPNIYPGGCAIIKAYQKPLENK